MGMGRAPGALVEAMIDPDTRSILVQAQTRARREAELVAKAETDGRTVRAEGALEAGGPSWAARVWAAITATRDTRPTGAVGVEVRKRWLIPAYRPVRLAGWRRWFRR